MMSSGERRIGSSGSDVPRAALWALAQGRDWVPPAADDELLTALRAAVHPVPDILGLRLEPVGDTGVRIVLGGRADMVELEVLPA